MFLPLKKMSASALDKIFSAAIKSHLKESTYNVPGTVLAFYIHQL